MIITWSKYQVDWNANNGQYTLLQYAAEQGRHGLVALLLDKGAWDEHGHVNHDILIPSSYPDLFVRSFSKWLWATTCGSCQKYIIYPLLFVRSFSKWLRLLSEIYNIPTSVCKELLQVVAALVRNRRGHLLHTMATIRCCIKHNFCEFQCFHSTTP